LLSSKGYNTVAFSNNYFISEKEFGLSRGFGSVEKDSHRNTFLKKLFCKTRQYVTQTKDNGAYLTSQLVKQWIAKKRSTESPFFLFINLMEAHAPYKHLQNRFLKQYLSSSDIKRLKTINQDRQKYLSRSIEMSENDFDILKSVYNSQISYLDFVIHDLTEFFKSTGILDQSLLIITSDHGDMIGEHQLMHHSYCLYEELIKIPLIFKLPGRSDNGNSYDHLVSLIDIYPTILDAFQINHTAVNEQLQGSNLFLKDNSTNRDFIFVECEKPKNEFQETYPDFDFSVYDRQLLAIRSKQYKYIWASDGNHELYDLENDPSEAINIVQKMPSIQIQMEQKLFDWYNSFEKASFEKTPDDIALNDKVKEHLKGLGYF
jgi:arylsulfatase A-like enzyme